MSPTQGATTKRGTALPQLKRPCQSVGVRVSNSGGHAKTWDSVSPTQGATSKHSMCPRPKGRHQSTQDPVPISSGHAKAWESVSRTQGATAKRGNPCPELKGAMKQRGFLYPQQEVPGQSVALHIPNSLGRAKAWESWSSTEGATPKLVSLYPQLKGQRRSAGVRVPNSTGHAKAWDSGSRTQWATSKHGLARPLELWIGTPTL